jgi:hypothetical protein
MWCWTRGWTPPLRASQSLFLLQYTMQRIFEAIISRKGIARGHSPKNSCVCERIPTIDLPILLQESHIFLYSIHCYENSKQIFPEKELRAATVPKMYVSVSEFPTYSAAGKSLFLYSTLQRTENFRNKYSQKRKLRAAIVPFPKLICVCERFIYSHDRSAYSAAVNYVDRSWEYKNRSQTHECGNWD